MTDGELVQRVRDLRSRGRSPKQIAHALNVSPARVAPLVRAVARDPAASAPQPALTGCWVSPGWSVGLTVDERRGWPDRPAAGGGTSGLAGVLVAREGRRGHNRAISVCGYLVDTYCLGVKDALGPLTMDAAGLRRFTDRFFSGFDGTPVPAQIDLANHLVWGAVAYARDLGFEPHPDFAAAAGHLDPLTGPSAIGFGCDGTPHYVQGPYDDADRIMRTLRRRVGLDNFRFTVEVPLHAV
jgi:hypothetical protein